MRMNVLVVLMLKNHQLSAKLIFALSRPTEWIDVLFWPDWLGTDDAHSGWTRTQLY